ncbi:MAG: TetR/AcrR family transcriptional regulator, partial [Ilumatobacteraceae bacterium]
MTTRRTQADRSAATRAALVGAARRLFAAEGYAEVGTERIAHAAGVTRGALYHQFADKVELFAAVFEVVEAELTQRLAELMADASADDIQDLMLAGAEAWLDESTEPEVQRIVLLDGPAVLGWERWREIALRYGLGLVTGALEAAVTAGAIADQPVEPLAIVFLGALDEAALYVARAPDPAAARAEMGPVVERLVRALLV